MASSSSFIEIQNAVAPFWLVGALLALVLAVLINTPDVLSVQTRGRARFWLGVLVGPVTVKV